MSSPRAKKSFERNIKAIYDTISTLGYKHVTDFSVSVDAERFYTSDIQRFHEETVKDLKNSDICVFEASTPSLAIGHLIGLAVELGKPIIALYTGGNNVPFFLTGVGDEKVQVLEYNLESLEEVLKGALDYASESQDTRFNFFISPKHQDYLDWISKDRKTPRAVHLRWLLERDMAANKAYQADLGKQKQGKENSPKKK